MPKVKQSIQVKLNQFLSQYGEKVFWTDGKILCCKLCDVRVTSEKSFNIQQHVTTEKHKRGIQRIENGKTLQQMLLRESCQSRSEQTNAAAVANSRCTQQRGTVQSGQ